MILFGWPGTVLGQSQERNRMLKGSFFLSAARKK